MNFYKSNKYVILWTVAYFVATWAIMRFMFNFNIFSALRWHQLMHAHLHGFAGMVFGILILAAVPMYIATTIVIARTKTPLFTITIPEFIKKAFQQTPMQEEIIETPAETKDSEPVENTPKNESIPTDVPTEMRVAYMRAREHISRTPVSAFDLGNVTNSNKQTSVPTTEQSTQEVQDMPIPSDFDIEDMNDAISDVPQFTDINFDDDDEEEIEIESDMDITDVHEMSDIDSDITKHLESKSIPYTIDNDVVITDKFAIVSHTDPDFWVADENAWFAAGKTRKSPIELVKRIANEHNVEPVLYLGSCNIMDIENLVPQWQDAGIRVITDLKDLI